MASQSDMFALHEDIAVMLRKGDGHKSIDLIMLPVLYENRYFPMRKVIHKVGSPTCDVNVESQEPR